MKAAASAVSNAVAIYRAQTTSCYRSPPKKSATSLPSMLVYPVSDNVWITESIWDKEPDDGILVDIVVGACAWEREFGSVFTTQFPSPAPRSDAELLCQAEGVFSAAPIISDAS